MKLSLGCGKDWKELGPDWQGIDIVDFGQKYFWNLETTPWPIEDESISHILAFHVLEHIHQDRVIAVMNECHRILERNGTMEIKVPSAHYPNEAFSDPTHLSTWTVDTFKNYFCGKSPRNADYGIKKWQTNLLDESVPGDIHIILQR